MKLDSREIDRIVTQALAEDVGPEGVEAGDVTSLATIPEDAQATYVVTAREPLIVCGLPIAASIVSEVDDTIEQRPKVEEGQLVDGGTVLMELQGNIRSILTAERTALNMLQYLSGIATLANVCAQAIEGTGAVVLDTRKTIPGTRHIAKYATSVGGAQNHRMGLYDAILIKDNHIAYAGSVSDAVRSAQAEYPKLSVEVECDTIEQVKEALAVKADRILLDNMNLDMLKEAVALGKGKAELEASGGVTLDTIRGIAETGVDYISVGALTHSAPAADIGLDSAK